MNMNLFRFPNTLPFPTQRLMEKNNFVGSINVLQQTLKTGTYPFI